MSAVQSQCGNEQLGILTGSPLRTWDQREAHKARILRKLELHECNSSASVWPLGLAVLSPLMGTPKAKSHKL